VSLSQLPAKWPTAAAPVAPRSIDRRRDHVSGFPPNSLHEFDYERLSVAASRFPERFAMFLEQNTHPPSPVARFPAGGLTVLNVSKITYLCDF
jgi:hypothetical protein